MVYLSLHQWWEEHKTKDDNTVQETLTSIDDKKDSQQEVKQAFVMTLISADHILWRVCVNAQTSRVKLTLG